MLKYSVSPVYVPVFQVSTQLFKPQVAKNMLGHDDDDFTDDAVQDSVRYYVHYFYLIMYLL